MWQKFLSRVAVEAGAVAAKIAQEELSEYAEKLRTPVEEEDDSDTEESQNDEEENNQKRE